MKSQLNTSNDSRNQFINNQTNSFYEANSQKQRADQFQKMFAAFQKMATDPALFMKMMSSVKQTTQPEQRRRQFQVQQHKYRNHEVSPRRNAESPISQKQSRRKGTDVLNRVSPQNNDSVLHKYYPDENYKQNLAESSVTISNKQQHIATMQDRPIQSSYNKQQRVNTQQKQTKQAQLINNSKINAEDQRPIKPVKGYTNTDDLNQSLIKNNSIQPINPSKYWEAQQRPIKGIQGDFKSHIMKQQGFAIPEYLDQNEAQKFNENETQQAPRVKHFLKRGSRQHLSSAKDKTKNNQKIGKKKIQKDDLQTSRSRNNFKPQPEKNQRSLSQNRILGRKSVSNKSIIKKAPPKQKMQQQKKTIKHGLNEDNENKSPKAKRLNQIKNRDNSESPTFNQELSPKIKKQKKRNIFEQSSDQQAEQIKNTKKMSQTKSQVVPGVYLTKKQLHLILSKYGKAEQHQSNSSQLQLQQLKSKYIDLCNLLTEQKKVLQQQVQKQKQQFQQYKISQLAKIKNEKKVQQRNLLNMQKNKQKQKQKQDFQNLKKAIQKQREQFKHKQRNYKIMIEKYKKQADQKIASTSNQQHKLTSDVVVKQETGKKSKSQYYSEQSGSNSQKGSSHNNSGVNKVSKQTLGAKQTRQVLPNYEDLKKPNASQSKGNSLQNTKKYEYYEDMNNKQANAKQNKYRQDENHYNNNTQEEQEQNQQQKDQYQQIVQYNKKMKLSDLAKIPLSIKMVTDQMIQNLFRCQNHPDYKKYLQLVSRSRTKINSNRNSSQRKTTNTYADGGKQIIFDTGVRKQYFSNGYVIIFFANGDIKQKLPDQTILYFYKQKEVDQITLPNKVNIYKFDNNQVQFHFEDKTVQLRHPDGTIKIL